MLLLEFFHQKMLQNIGNVTRRKNVISLEKQKQCITTVGNRDGKKVFWLIGFTGILLSVFIAQVHLFLFSL